VTDFTSFYHLPSTIIGNKKHNILRAVYAYYNVATTMSMHDLMRDALILARNMQVDVFNALDLMENRDIFEELKFGAGDGHLQYYLYNWKCPEISSLETGLVLL
jgi:glycylpeptide N-tetradecanoyltransferase